MAVTLAGIGLAIAALVFFRVSDGEQRIPKRIYPVSAKALPARAELSMGDFIIERVERSGDKLQLSCRVRMPTRPALGGVVHPAKYRPAPPPRLEDDLGNRAAFQRAADAIDELRANESVLRDYAQDDSGHLDYEFTCQFEMPPSNAKQLTFVFPGEYILTRESTKQPWIIHNGLEVAVTFPASAISAGQTR